MATINDNLLVIKSNPILEGRFADVLTPREMDLLTVLFTTISQNSDDISRVRVSALDLKRLFNISGGSAYSTIAQVSKTLLSRVIWINTEKSLLQHQILSEAEYFHGEGYAEFKFHERLRPFLLQIKQYAKFSLKNILALNSFYSKRLYELLIQYRGMADKTGAWTREISLKDLRDFFGIAKGDYVLYGHLKREVITPGVLSISERTDISVVFKEKKLGRKVDSIVFFVKEKEEHKEEKQEISSPEQAGALSILLSNGVSPKMADKLTAEHEPDYIAFAVDKLNTAKKTDNIENSAGWLVSVLSSGALKLEFLQAKKKEEQQQQEAINKAKREEFEETRKRIQTAYKEYTRKAVEMFLGVYSYEEEEEKREQFIAFMKKAGVPDFSIKDFKKNGWFSALIFQKTIEFFVTHEEMPIIEIDVFAKKQGVPNYAEIVEFLK